MKQLTQNEIARTAFKAVHPGGIESPHGYTTSRDKNEMCPYCKNENTDVVRDVAELGRFRQFYGDSVKKFTAVSCWCCGGVWSFYEP
jgi:hypothetical protein